MSWEPQAGEHVYHICEFNLSLCEMRKKGIDGFRNWGYEVVESVMVEKYTWRSKSGSATIGWKSELVRRDVGNVTEETKCFYWKTGDLGKLVFAHMKEAVAQAEERTKMAERALHEPRYERRPMYKNWMYWKVPQLEGVRENTKHKEVEKVERRSQMRRRKAVLPEDLYIRWRDGEISAVAGAEELGVSEMTFASYAKEMLAERGETHKQKTNVKPVSERFKRAYERWKNGEIPTYAAVQESGLCYATFRYQAKKWEMMKEGLLEESIEKE